MQAAFAIMAGALVLLAGVAHVADRRRLKRSRLDHVGFMPWPTVAFAGTVGAILFTALALMSG